MKWDYASRGGNVWPVREGDLWGVGEHRLLCGDLERDTPAVLRRLIGDTPLPLCYVDPPWGRGLHKGFRTKAGLEGPADYDGLMRAILALCGAARIALVEMGNREVPALLGYARSVGLEQADCWSITYYRNRPCTLLAFGERAEFPAFTGLDDADTPLLAVEALTARGDLVMDPCTGLGCTAEAVARAGRRFLGSELHPRRASATLERLRRLGAGTPEPIERVTV